MSQAEQITAVVGVLTVAVAVLGVLFTALFGFLEHLRFQRKIRLEERRWAEELSNQIELELVKARINEYPKIIAHLKVISAREISDLTPNSAKQLGQSLHDELYEPVVISMQGDTRQALVNLRDACFLFAEGEIPLDLFDKARRLFLSALFRDMGSLEDWYPQLPSSIEKMRARFEALSDNRSNHKTS